MRLFIMPGRSCHDTQKVSFSRCSNSETLLLPALYQHFSVWSREIYRWATFQRGKGKKTSEIRRFQRFLVRVGRLELPASCSQSKRATNCATPGYSVFPAWYHAEKKKASFSCLWAPLWSSPILREFFNWGISAASYCPKGFRVFAFRKMDRVSILPKRQAHYQLC